MRRTASEWTTNACAVGLFGVFMSALFTIQHSEHAEQFLRWRPFLDFVGQHPFQSRVLPFIMARIVSAFHWLSSAGLFQFFQAIDFTATCIAFWFVWKTARRLLQDSAAVLTVLMLFWWQMWATFVISPVHNYYYPYDMMSVAFVSCALWGIASGWGLKPLLALTIPAMFNRETSVIIPIFYLAFHWPASKTVWRDVVSLLAVCVLIKMGISWALRANDEMVSLYHVPGLLRFHYNFSFLTFKPELLHTLNVFFSFGMVWLLLPWPGPTDVRLRRMMWCLVPYFLGMMVVGNLSEIRIFAEFIPLMALLLASKLVKQPQGPLQHGTMAALVRG